MNASDDKEEILDFDSTSIIETLSLDDEVSNKIEEMLDFFDESNKNNKIKEEVKLDSLLENVKDEKKIKIDVKEEKLDEYIPSIKDLNIKNLKTRKVVKKVMLYTIIVMLFCFEFFLTKTGEILNDIRVYASDALPIKIEKNEKYGYIDYTGNKLSEPKYDFAEDFKSNYAIVKNSSNLPLIIDKGGKEAIKSGKYFSLNRTGSNIVASINTSSGLKYGILNNELKKITDFEYDMIDYYDDVYTFVKKNTVGLINNDGKVIYKYKLTDNVDKNIKIYVSSTSSNDVKYGVVLVNSSFQIINLSTGKEITKPTLNRIKPLNNNVFVESMDNSSTYLYIENDDIIIESSDYQSLSMNSIKTGVLLALKSNLKYDLISTKTKEIIKKDVIDSEIYYGDSIFMYKDYSFKKNKDIIYMIKDGEIYKELYADFDIYKPFLNGGAIVKYSDETYNYINQDGNIISDKRFILANEFDSYGEAICQTEDGFGVINKNGKIIIPFENIDIKMTSGTVKKNTSTSINNVFYAVKKENRYGLYNKNGKKYNKKFYNEVLFDENYPIIKVSSDISDEMLLVENKKTINLTSFNSEYKAYENYVIIKDEYYNYKGKLIYVNKNYKESDGA